MTKQNNEKSKQTNDISFLDIQKRVNDTHSQIISRHTLIPDFHFTELTPDEEKVFEEATNYIISTRRWDDIRTFFDDCALYGSPWIQKAFMKCQKFIPKEELYRITTSVYRSYGYKFPLDPIINLIRLRPSDYLSELPYEFWDIDPINVYRVSPTSPANIEHLPNELSWTLDPAVAYREWQYRASKRHKYYHIYEAEIYKKDIIAYMPEMSEHEILQHNGVFDVNNLSIVVLGGMCRFQEEYKLKLAFDKVRKARPPIETIDDATDYYPLQYQNRHKFGL